jgi:hypothetical protein
MEYTARDPIENALQALHLKRTALKDAIVSLEELIPFAATNTPTRARRGRKSMGAAERLQVSERMLKYWAARRVADPHTNVPPAIISS